VDVSAKVRVVFPPLPRLCGGEGRGEGVFGRRQTPHPNPLPAKPGEREYELRPPHIAVDTLGNLLALTVTAANEQERAQVGELAAKVQEVTEGTVQIAFVDQGYTGDDGAGQAKKYDIHLEVVKHTEAKKGFVLLPRRWVVERTFGWLGRFRRLARDYERLTEVLAGWHWLAFLLLIVKWIGFQSQ